jgi:hypothetical protein
LLEVLAFRENVGGEQKVDLAVRWDVATLDDALGREPR